MTKSNFLKKVSEKQSKAEDIAKKVIKDPKFLPELLDVFLSDAARVKFKSAKILSLISKESPDLLYPHFDFFAKHLDNENNILKWNVMDVIANLTAVDFKKKFDKLFKKYYGMLYQGSLITAGHMLVSSGVIVKSKPYLEEKITKEILQIDKLPLPTKECQNILKGYAIKVFDQYFDRIKDKKKVIAFVKKELKNTRNSTRKKAEMFLKKWGKK